MMYKELLLIAAADTHRVSTLLNRPKYRRMSSLLRMYVCMYVCTVTNVKGKEMERDSRE